jgi:hypothetical protein
VRGSTKAFCRTGLGGSRGTAVARGRLGAGSPSAESERNCGSSAETAVNAGWLAPSELLHEHICSSASPSPVLASSMLTALSQTVPPDVLLLLIPAASSMAAS